MSGLEFFLLFIGFLFIVISLFLVDKKKNDEKIKGSPNAELVFSEIEMKKITEKVKEKIEDIAANYILDTDDKLSGISNEKIIAINDFTDQLFVKIDNNHNEVIFLYNMLQEKEDEMKSTLNRMEVVRKENQAFIDKVIELRNNKIKASANNQKADSSNQKKQLEELTDSKKGKIKHQDDRSSKLVSNSDIKDSKQDIKEQLSSDYNNGKDEVNSENKNEKILKLYKEKKSLIEISKVLGIGQGEVKLVIDLYGKGI